MYAKPLLMMSIDTIMGSQGKWGTADIGLVYERKGEEKDAVLHVAGREIEEQKFIMSLIEGHLECLGKGELYELDASKTRSSVFSLRSAVPWALWTL